MRKLTGAVVYMRPELWKLVRLGVPFVDALNDMSDPSLPLTPPKYTEWGNPTKVKDIYAYMASYCPMTT